MNPDYTELRTFDSPASDKISFQCREIDEDIIPSPQPTREYHEQTVRNMEYNDPNGLEFRTLLESLSDSVTEDAGFILSAPADIEFIVGESGIETAYTSFERDSFIETVPRPPTETNSAFQIRLNTFWTANAPNSVGLLSLPPTTVNPELSPQVLPKILQPNVCQDWLTADILIQEDTYIKTGTPLVHILPIQF